MDLGLTFPADGTISGEGIDDVARFIIDGFFDPARNEASWTKAYIGMHTVKYNGLYDGRTICGSWTLGIGSGGFWIWPSALEAEEAQGAEIEIPVASTVSLSFQGLPK
jgi:hypothetical protein